jgi:DNA-binding IclR family transcriptional regulator
LSQDLDLKISTLHRILATLSEMGYVEQSHETRKYRATLKVFQLGLKVKSRLSLVSLARPYMKELGHEFKEAVNLAYFVGGYAVVIDRVESRLTLSSNLTLGRHLPAYCTAFGKVFLADMVPTDLREYALAHPFTKFTQKTISSWEELQQELLKVQNQGYALDNQELDEGIRCVAAPVRDTSGKVQAAMSISGASSRFTMEALEACLGRLGEATHKVSAKLGYIAE